MIKKDLEREIITSMVSRGLASSHDIKEPCAHFFFYKNKVYVNIQAQNR